MANARAVQTALKSNVAFRQWCACRYKITQSAFILDSRSKRHATSSAYDLKRETHSSVGPSVRLLLTLYDIDPASVTATGPHHRLLKGDVLQHIAGNNLEPKPLQALARQAAADSVEANATTTDIKTKTVLSPPIAPRLNPLPVLEDTEYIDVELTSTRQAIAKRVSQSKLDIPHLYASTECLMTKLEELRLSLAESGSQVSINDFIVKACAIALQRMPKMNCSWNDGEITALDSIDISVAVVTPSGLLMPVVSGANMKSLEEISNTVEVLESQANDGTLQPSEMSGSSFTVSDLGTYGIKECTAVINPPQTAILSVGCEQATLHEGAVVPSMNFSLTFDGRAIVADQAAEFLSLLKRLLENPIEMGL